MASRVGAGQDLARASQRGPSSPVDRECSQPGRCLLGGDCYCKTVPRDRCDRAMHPARTFPLGREPFLLLRSFKDWNRQVFSPARHSHLSARTARVQPYAHRVLDPLLNPATDAYDLNPARQEPSAVLHSFVDPSYARLCRRTPDEAGGKGAPELPLSSPATMEFLAPGRRGAWLIPISEGEAPVPLLTSPALWPADTTLPPSSRSSSSRPAKTTITRKARSTDGEDPAIPLEWTDARLVVLWIYLTSLHEGRGFGNIRAQAISGGGSSQGDLLKINCDAHLALAIRGLLDRLNVKGVAKRVGGGGDGGPANEKLQRLKREGACTDDDEKWFKGRALVWVDEQSRAILTA